MSSTRLAVLLGALFLAAQLPLLGSTARHHGDEKYYTDAALRMMRDGDYVTPRYEDGSIRLRKPVLTYWAILGGWKLLGVNYAASRLPMLLAAMGVLFLVHRFARRVLGREDAALLAVAFLIADQELFTAAWRQNPDALLTLFVTLALVGFGLHGFTAGGDRKALLAGYLGAGLAVATKGFLGAAAAAYALIFLAARRGRAGSDGNASGPHGGVLRTGRYHIAGALLAVTVGGAWYAAVALRHGPPALLDFLRDQAALDAGETPPDLPWRALGYLGLTMGNFLPAVVVIAAAWFVARARLRAGFALRRDSMAYALGWVVLVLIVFTLGSVFRPRYMLPAHPMVAVLAGGLVAGLLDDPRLMGRLGNGRLWRGVGLAAGIVLGVAGWHLDPRFPVAGFVLCALTLGLERLARGRPPQVALAAGCLWILGGLWTYDAFVRPIYGGGAKPEGVEVLRGLPGGTPVLAVGVPDRFLAQVAVLSRGRVLPESRSTLPDRTDDSTQVLLLEESRARARAEGADRLILVGESYRHIDAALFLDSWRGKDRAALLAERRRGYCFLVPSRD